MYQLGKRLAELTEIEDAVVENRDKKSLLIDKYEEILYFHFQMIDQNHQWYI